MNNHKHVIEWFYTFRIDYKYENYWNTPVRFRNIVIRLKKIVFRNV